MARNKFDVDEKRESPFQWSHMKMAGKYVGRHKYKMLLALLLSGVASIAALYIPKITQWVLDEAVPNKDTAMIGRLALTFVGIIVLGIVMNTIRSRIMVKVSQQIIHDIRSDLFAHLQKLPFTYYDSRPAGPEVHGRWREDRGRCSRQRECRNRCRDRWRSRKLRIRIR